MLSFFSSYKARTGNRDNTAPDTPLVPDIRRTRIAASAGTLEKRKVRLGSTWRSRFSDKEKKIDYKINEVVNIILKTI